MTEEQARLALAGLEDVLQRCGLGWLARRVADDFEQRRDVENRVRSQLEMLVDSTMRVLQLGRELAVAVPPMLLSGTEATSVMFADSDVEETDIRDATTLAEGDEEGLAFEELVAALRNLRRAIYEDQ